MPWFPMFVDLTGKRVLVVGAGKIAARRVGTLTRFCEHVTVVAPSIHPDIEQMGVTLCRRCYDPADLDGVDLAVAATDDAELNADIAKACRERGIPVNVASDQTLCDFYFPGVAVQGDVVAGVTANGKDHHLARRATEAVRKALEDITP